MTDENIPPRAVVWLKEKGLDIFDIKTKGLAGTPDEEIVSIDEEIVSIAEMQQRIIITQDSDLVTILCKVGLQNSGVIFFRPGHVSSDHLIKSLETLFSADIDVRIRFILVGGAKKDVFRIHLRLL